MAVIEPYNPIDARGTPVYVWSGPIHELGQDWYRIQFMYMGHFPNAEGQSIFGWVLAADAATALVPAAIECPKEVWDLGVLADEVRLQCAGSTELHLTGVIVSSGGGPPPYVGDPQWLAGKAYFRLMPTDVHQSLGTFVIHLPHDERLWRLATDPEVRLAAQVQVVGRFDHPAAKGCTLEPRFEDLAPMSRDEQVQWCRQRLVVSEITVVGEPRWSPAVGWYPAPGQQPAAGDGWRLLGSANRAEIAIVPSGDGNVDIALDQEAYDILWWGMGLSGEQAAIDFDQEIVARFITGVSGTCPAIVFDGIGVVSGGSLVHGRFSYPNVFPSAEPGVTYGCTTDWHPHGFLIAISRDVLPGDQFTLRLMRDRACPGCGSDLDELEVDLRD